MLEKTACFRQRPKERIITQEGYLYVLVALLFSILMTLFFGWQWGICSLLVPVYAASFFRNPKRRSPRGEEWIIAPADGKVLAIEECFEPWYLKEKAKCIQIFMSPFNCHINRAPVRGKVTACYHRDGSFKAAFRPKAMEHNEHHAILMEDEKGFRWLVVQIAGFLARRIVSYVQAGDELSKGERFGLIQFGSRADLYCPLQAQIFVKSGDKVYGGKTILGKIEKV